MIKTLNTLALTLLILTIGATGAYAQCGEIPVVGQRLLQQLADKFPAEIQAPDDDTRRVWAMRAAEQLAFSVSPEWGTKRAGRDNPPSKDAVARIIGGKLCSWDIVNGASRRLQFGHGEVMDVAQIFISVTPRNHLSATTPDPPGNPEVEGRLAALEAKVQLLEEAIGKAVATVRSVEEELSRVAAMAVTSGEVIAAIDEAIARLSVVGKTRTTWGHQHSVDLAVIKK